jgi:signal transduction histidine kinase
VHLRPARLDLVVESVVGDLSSTDLVVTSAGDGSATVTVDVDGHRITLITTATVALLDPVLVERAVANVVQNALRHGHAPGRPAVVTLTVASHDGRAVVTVADYGPGLRAPIERSGLGLSVVRWVMREHGGLLLLGTGRRPGTCIRLVFPQARKPWMLRRAPNQVWSSTTRADR